MADSIFGPATDDAQIETAVLRLVRKWLDTYLVHVERVNDLDERHWARPKHWLIDDEQDITDTDPVPFLQCVTTGESEPPTVAGDTDLITVRSGFLIGAYCQGSDENETRQMTRHYAWAVAALLEHKGGELAPLCQVAGRPQKTYQPLVDEQDELLGLAVVAFTADIAAVRSVTGGPDIPYPDPETQEPVPDDPGLPLFETAEIDVNDSHFSETFEPPET